ncbi:hypothetical protein HYW82_03095 [Candidatus Peregrinibacteria bacterium]|nr:hypothetical protein [Candidatus Peregrinibacteria bacterium]
MRKLAAATILATVSLGSPTVPAQSAPTAEKSTSLDLCDTIIQSIRGGSGELRLILREYPGKTRKITAFEPTLNSNARAKCGLADNNSGLDFEQKDVSSLQIEEPGFPGKPGKNDNPIPQPPYKFIDRSNEHKDNRDSKPDGIPDLICDEHICKPFSDFTAKGKKWLQDRFNKVVQDTLTGFKKTGKPEIPKTP